MANSTAMADIMSRNMNTLTPSAAIIARLKPRRCERGEMYIKATPEGAVDVIDNHDASNDADHASGNYYHVLSAAVTASITMASK
jgi:hypothetical protein